MFLTFQASVGLRTYDGPPLPYKAADYDAKGTVGTTVKLTVHERKAAADKKFPPFLLQLDDGVRSDLVVCDDYAEMLAARVYLAPLVR